MSKIDPKPSGKTGSTTTAGALVLVAGYVCAQFGLDVPGEVLAAGVFLAMSAVAYLMPAREPGKHEAT